MLQVFLQGTLLYKECGPDGSFNCDHVHSLRDILSSRRWQLEKCIQNLVRSPFEYFQLLGSAQRGAPCYGRSYGASKIR